MKPFPRSIACQACAPKLTPLLLGAVVALSGLSDPACAQFKVVLPDGSITYTDRPPATANAQVTSMNRRGTKLAPEAGEAAAAIPIELRQAAQRYPVTLYGSSDCEACEGARRMLQQRGVPYTEKRIASDDDVLALERLVGARMVPSLTIGSQPLRGYTEAEWTAYLDAAGYPKESKLPRSWLPPPVQALVEKTVVAARPEAPRAEAPSAVPAAPLPASGPRF